MKRRDLLKASAGLALSGTLPSRTLFADPLEYDGDFLIQIQAGGAWDVSSFCDPKENMGTQIINNWAKTKSIRRAGNIDYAPFANNSELFDKHYDKMLVINGVNSYTNGHSAGKQYNFTGSTQANYPSLSAAFAATHKSDFAMPCLMNGGAFFSGGIIVPTRVGNDIATFNTLLEPNNRYGKTLIDGVDQSSIDNYRRARANRLMQQTGVPSKRKLIEDFIIANKDYSNFEEFKIVLDSVDTTGYDISTSLSRQILYSMVAFKVGLSVSADVVMNRFDTHSNHDQLQAQQLTTLNNAVLLMWHLADQLDIEDRLNVFIASDFGRTPYYNEAGGKDHWPIGSTVIMKSGVPWANRVVGLTDETQQSKKINVNSLREDNGSGVTIEPKHVMEFARKVLKINNAPELKSYSLRVDDEYIDFSGGMLS